MFISILSGHMQTVWVVALLVLLPSTPGMSNFSLQSMTWVPGGVKIGPADTRSMKPEVPGKVPSGTMLVGVVEYYV